MGEYSGETYVKTKTKSLEISHKSVQLKYKITQSSKFSNTRRNLPVCFKLFFTKTDTPPDPLGADLFFVLNSKDVYPVKMFLNLSPFNTPHVSQKPRMLNLEQYF